MIMKLLIEYEYERRKKKVKRTKRKGGESGREIRKVPVKELRTKEE